MSQNEATPVRRLRLFLRDHRALDANARVPEGQFLSTYLASRNRYVNLTDIVWLGTGEELPHISLKVDKVLWAASQDGALPLTSARAAVSSRRVEIELEGGYLLSAGLLLVENQRLSDYLQGAPPFVPLQRTRLWPREKELGDVVVNQDSIQVVRELKGAEADQPLPPLPDRPEDEPLPMLPDRDDAEPLPPLPDRDEEPLPPLADSARQGPRAEREQDEGLGSTS